MTRLAAVTVGSKVLASIENADRVGINKTHQLMSPTTAANGTIGTYGAVSFSAVASVSLNGCFTSEFDWYEIKYFATSSGAALVSMTLRVSGTDSVTGYDRVVQRANNAANSVGSTFNQASWPLNLSGVTGAHFGSLDLFNPALAAATLALPLIGSTANPMTTADGNAYNSTLQHRPLTAYDGFTLTASTGTITGTVRVYGVI